METVQEFFDIWNGKGCNPDNAYGNQCVDIADQYAKDVVGSPLPGVRYAKDFWEMNLNGYDKIPNTSLNVPQKGDIIIWGTKIGPAGHIAIFDQGTAYSFISFDQNWPSQGYIDTNGNFIGTGACHYQNHTYEGVLGWFHPQKITPPVLNPDGAKATRFDQMLTVLFQAGFLPNDHSENYLTNDDALNALKALNDNRINQSQRAGKWDQICLKLGFNGDSNQVSPDDLFNKCTTGQPVAGASTPVVEVPIMYPTSDSPIPQPNPPTPNEPLSPLDKIYRLIVNLIAGIKNS